MPNKRELFRFHMCILKFSHNAPFGLLLACPGLLFSFAPPAHFLPSSSSHSLVLLVALATFFLFIIFLLFFFSPHSFLSLFRPPASTAISRAASISPIPLPTDSCTGNSIFPMVAEPDDTWPASADVFAPRTASLTDVAPSSARTDSPGACPPVLQLQLVPRLPVFLGATRGGVSSPPSLDGCVSQAPSCLAACRSFPTSETEAAGRFRLDCRG